MASERVLVVDDEPEILRLCVYLLEDEGFETEGLTSAHEALARVRRESYDLLIADIKMPEMDGLELLRRVAAIDPNLVTLIITGYATMDRAIAAVNAGARGFVLKPFGVDELIAAVNSALNQKRMEEERQRLSSQLPILEIGQALLLEGDVEGLSRRLLEVLVREMRVERAALLLFDEQQATLHLGAQVNWPDELSGSLEPIGRGEPVGWAFEEEGVQTVERERLVGQGPFWAALCEGIPPAPVILAPMRTGQRDVGILVVCRPAASFSASEQNLLAILAGQMAIALENVRMYALEQHRTEALALALEQQQDLDRLKGEFMRNVSHELRTPLAMILGYAELLIAGDLGPVTAEQRASLEIIVQRASTLRELVENITAILENESREPVIERVWLAELVAGALADFEVLAKRAGLTISGAVEAPGAVVLGDESHLRRMIDNLMSNALKFTPAGGEVTVRLEPRDGQVMLSVSDNGIGIPEGHEARIFERFYQVDGTIRRQYGGSGLGLALVKEIVERHHGSVTVESRWGEGTTFRVYLPEAEPETVAMPS